MLFSVGLFLLRTAFLQIILTILLKFLVIFLEVLENLEVIIFIVGLDIKTQQREEYLFTHQPMVLLID